MGKATDGAKGCRGSSVKPGDHKRKVKCPCNAFLNCSSRVPYGGSVWSDPVKKKDAMSIITYGSTGAGQTRSYEGRGYYKKLHKLLDNGQTRTLILHELTDKYVKNHMESLVLENTGHYTNFQRSMILRANLVKNGLVLKSDGFPDGRDDFERMMPYSGLYQGDEWNIDHVKIRAKGGCNRFCNAQILSRQVNMDKGDQGQGCPCADARKQGESPAPGQEDFEVGGNTEKTRYQLWQCTALSNNQEKPANKVPSYPPGMMKRYTKDCKICDLDDPCNWSAALQRNAKQSVMQKVEKICK